MKERFVLAMTLTLVLIGVSGLTIKIQRVEASETIYINADGSVSPPGAPISSGDNVTYTFTDNINDFIRVNRNNIVVDGDGHTLQGNGTGTGIDLSGRSNVTIKNMEVKGFFTGIKLWHSSNNTISGNNITANNQHGIQLYEDCDYTIIYGNNITNNDRGIDIEDGRHAVYHNNFIGNNKHVNALVYSTNTWDNGVEGNYWSNYTGVDSDHDGIGDTSHVIDANNEDNCPLMGMFHSFNASLGYYVNVISNSTIEDFEYFESNSTIKMYVSNMTTSQAFGFCRVCIPKNLMSPPYTVMINDGMTSVLNFNGTVHENDTHMWIYFAYEHSTHKVEIIPEFPTWTSIMLLLILLTVATVIIKRRLLKTPIH